MPLLQGPHVSTDCAIVKGQVKWLRHATGVPGPEGTFKYWTLHADEMPEVATYLKTWVSKYMAAYTGMMNFEAIGGKIIEAHLRFADQWCDLNGKGWIEAMVRLYTMAFGLHEASGASLFHSALRPEQQQFVHTPRDLQARIRACQTSQAADYL